MKTEKTEIVESPEFHKRLSKLEDEIRLINHNINVSLQKVYIINPRALTHPEFDEPKHLDGVLGKFDELNYEAEKARLSLEVLRDNLINLVG